MSRPHGGKNNESRLATKLIVYISVVLALFVLISALLYRLVEFVQRIAQWRTSAFIGLMAITATLFVSASIFMLFWGLRASNRKPRLQSLSTNLGVSLLVGTLVSFIVLGFDQARSQQAIEASEQQSFQSLLGSMNDFTGVDFRGRDLSYLILPRHVFRQADLTTVNLEGTQLYSADFREAKLEGAKLVKANIAQANLQDANLRLANLQTVQAYKANLQHVNAEQANFQEADLSQADLRDADLWQADLRAANVGGAALSGADFRGTKLDRVVFESADLRGVDFSQADFGSISAQDSQELYARFRGATIDNTTLFPDGFSKSLIPDAVVLHSSPANSERVPKLGRLIHRSR
ncbi:MAG: pentapeptide repeat-containing protein [Egibacteraceae bacterium]